MLDGTLESLTLLHESLPWVSSSWLNLIERWFEELTQKAVRRGVFLSVPDLVQAIDDFLAAWNKNPKPFVWTAKLEEILKKIERARAKLQAIEPGCTEPRRQHRLLGWSRGGLAT